MANERRPDRVEGLTEAVRKAGAKGPPPVHLWNPPFCGDIDMRIAADGAWFYHGTPIGRPALVKLFASVLKREGDRYFLVTPVEKVGITVEDAPFVAVEMNATSGNAGPVLTFRTNVDDTVTCGPENALRFEAQDGEDGVVKPYLHVRRDLWARVSRPVFYEMVERGETRGTGDAAMFGIASGGSFFPMAKADSLRDLA